MFTKQAMAKVFVVLIDPCIMKNAQAVLFTWLWKFVLPDLRHLVMDWLN